MKKYICNNCGEIYDEKLYSFIIENKRIMCPKLGCYGEVKEIDEILIEPVQKLLKLGFSFCSSSITTNYDNGFEIKTTIDFYRSFKGEYITDEELDKIKQILPIEIEFDKKDDKFTFILIQKNNRVSKIDVMHEMLDDCKILELWTSTDLASFVYSLEHWCEGEGYGDSEDIDCLITPELFAETLKDAENKSDDTLPSIAALIKENNAVHEFFNTVNSSLNEICNGSESNNDSVSLVDDDTKELQKSLIDFENRNLSLFQDKIVFKSKTEENVGAIINGLLDNSYKSSEEVTEVKEDTKEEVSEDVKEEVTEEVKEDVKEEVSKGVKEEVSEDVKEEVKDTPVKTELKDISVENKREQIERRNRINVRCIRKQILNSFKRNSILRFYFR